ncbi:unnamed protein product, partial [Heterotrigona itama]
MIDVRGLDDRDLALREFNVASTGCIENSMGIWNEISYFLQTTNTDSRSFERSLGERYSVKFLHEVSRGFANSRNHWRTTENHSNRVN